MSELKAGVPTQIPYELFDFDGSLLVDADISSLTYSVYSITEAQEVKASTVLPNLASGTIELTAAEMALIGAEDSELWRLCLIANTDYPFSVVFTVVSGSCI